MDINAPDLDPDLSGIIANSLHVIRPPITVTSLDGITEIDHDPDQKVTVELTPWEWELSTASMECELAAEALNTAATKAMSCGNHADGADIWEAVALQWQEYGALGTEPRYVIATLLNARYGQSII
jgi:hypothetical protein